MVTLEELYLRSYIVGGNEWEKTDSLKKKLFVNAFRQARKDRLSYDFIVEVVSHCQGTIDAIDNPPFELCCEAVALNGEELLRVPRHIWCQDLYVLALQTCGFVLVSIPKEEWTKDLCAMAVRQWGSMLEHIDKDYIDNYLCMLAVQSPVSYLALMYVPEDLQTYAMCKAAVKNNGNSIEFVKDKKNITPELRWLAIENGARLDLIDEDFQTLELCMLAIQKNIYSFQYIKKEFLTPELLSAAVQKDGMVLELIDPSQITLDLCWKAVKNEPFALGLVPKKFQSHELYMEAISSGKDAIVDIPEDKRTKEICIIALRNLIACHSSIPKHLLTLDFYESVLQGNTNILPYLYFHNSQFYWHLSNKYNLMVVKLGFVVDVDTLEIRSILGAYLD